MDRRVSSPGMLREPVSARCGGRSGACCVGRFRRATWAGSGGLRGAVRGMLRGSGLDDASQVAKSPGRDRGSGCGRSCPISAGAAVRFLRTARPSGRPAPRARARSGAIPSGSRTLPAIRPASISAPPGRRSACGSCGTGRCRKPCSGDGLTAAPQPTPADAYASGCGWPAGLSLRLPDDWRGGFYLVIVRAVSPAGEVWEREHGFTLCAFMIAELSGLRRPDPP